MFMERVEEKFAVGASYTFAKCNSFGGGVHHKVFEAVHDLDAKENVAVLRRFDCFFDALHCTLSKDFFVFART
jgi:hypothetical protein